MTRNLLILGAGQYGQMVYEVAQAMNRFARIDFLDDNYPDAIGRMADFAQFTDQFTDAVVAIGNSDLRLTLLEQLRSHYNLPTILHPQATVMPSAQTGDGCVIEPQAVIQSHAVLGKGCLISAGAVINHNAVLGEGCHIDCLAAVPARGQVPAKTKVMIGTVFTE
jgi:UDP-3-O-[3-hydroxymyristoyl] glucosamine N-acyltransferase